MARLFVEKNFSAESKRAVEEMVGRVHAEFRSRLAKNTWLTKATRQQALYKLDKVKISVGYPEKWIDYSAVDIRPGEYFGDLERISEFLAQRNLARWGGPVAEDEFANPSETLPTLINAGYDPLRNAIEIPAAFLQPPIYDPKGDPATNFCAIGAVIGHEITHGFDSGAATTTKSAAPAIGGSRRTRSSSTRRRKNWFANRVTIRYCPASKPTAN